MRDSDRGENREESEIRHSFHRLIHSGECADTVGRVVGGWPPCDGHVRVF